MHYILFQNIFKIKDTWEIADRRETTTLPKILPSLRNSILGISSRKVWETFENSTFRSQNVFPRPNVYIYISPPSLYNVYKTTMYISHGGRYGSTCVDKVQRGFEKKKKEGKKMPIEITVQLRHRYHDDALRCLWRGPKWKRGCVTSLPLGHVGAPSRFHLLGCRTDVPDHLLRS